MANLHRIARDFRILQAIREEADGDSDVFEWESRMYKCGHAEIKDYLAKHAAFLNFLEPNNYSQGKESA